MKRKIATSIAKLCEKKEALSYNGSYEPLKLWIGQPQKRIIKK